MMDSPPDPTHTPDALNRKGQWTLPGNPKCICSVFLGGKVPGKLTFPIDGHLMDYLAETWHFSQALGQPQGVAPSQQLPFLSKALSTHPDSAGGHR